MRTPAPNSFTAMVAFAASLAATPAAAHQQAEASFFFDLPAQSLADSVLKVAAQSGVNVAADATLLEGHRAPELRGEYTARQALAHLVEGSGLGVAAVNGTLVLRRLDASGQEAEGGDIVVTGSHVRGGQPTSPIITIGRKAIEESGATSVEALMRQLPQNSQGGVNQENFAAPGAGADITEHGAGLNLRGLGQRATLVLVNGRRIAPSGVGSFVDVSRDLLDRVARRRGLVA